MPAPRLGVSGLGRLGLSLYDVLAERELARIKEAAAAEAARQTRFKEGIELGTARRGDAKQQLDEQIARESAAKTAWEQGHPKGELVSNSLGADGKPAAVLLNPYSGDAIGAPVPQYVKPPEPRYSLHAGTGPDGLPENTTLEETSGVVTTVPGHKPPVPVAPRDPPETFSPMTLDDGEGNPTIAAFGNRSGNARLLPNLKPYVAPRPATADDEHNLNNYETTRLGNATMAKWESQLKPNDLLAMSSATTWNEAVRMAAMSKAGKNFLTGARIFIESYARDKTGAASSATEWALFKAEALPLLGDPPESVAVKHRYREMMEDLYATNAGQAFVNKYGYRYVPHTKPTVAMERGVDGTYAPAPPPGSTPRSATPAPRNATPAPRSATPAPPPTRPMASHANGPAPAPGAIDGRYVRDPVTGKLVLQDAR